MPLLRVTAKGADVAFDSAVRVPGAQKVGENVIRRWWWRWRRRVWRQRLRVVDVVLHAQEDEPISDPAWLSSDPPRRYTESLKDRARQIRHRLIVLDAKLGDLPTATLRAVR